MAETEENKKQYDEEWMEMREYDMSRQCYHDVISHNDFGCAFAHTNL